MDSEQKKKTIRHFAKHLFLVGHVYVERKKARAELGQFLERLKDSIIRMRFSYTDVERLKKKIDSMLLLERKFGRFYRGEDKVDVELNNRVIALEKELSAEKEEKMRIKMDNEEKIKQLQQTLDNIKDHMKYLLLEKAKKHHRMKELEKKISSRAVSKH